MKKPDPVKEIPPEVQRRLDALECLIDASYNGKVKTFAEKTGIAAPQVNQWFSGYRMLRENAVRRLENATGKPVGWFDSPRESASENASTMIAPFRTARLPIDAVVSQLAEWLLLIDPGNRETVGLALKQLAVDPSKPEFCVGVLRSATGTSETAVDKAHALR